MQEVPAHRYFLIEHHANPYLVFYLLTNRSKYSFQNAMFFFKKNKLWKICDEGLGEEAIKKLTRRINGGYNGLDHRIELTKKYIRYKL